MPRKKVIGSPKPEKNPLGIEKKVKPVLKTPSVIRLKLKLPSDTRNVQDIGSEVVVNKDIVKEDKKPVTSQTATVKRKYVRKKVLNGEQPTITNATVKQRGGVTDSVHNDYSLKSEDVPKVIKEPLNRKKSILKRQRLKKNPLNGKPATNEDATIDTCDGVTVQNDNTVETIDFKIDKKPVTRKKTVAKRQGLKKILNGEQAKNKNANVKKRTQPKVLTNNATGTIKKDDTKYDIPKVNENYYKILLANEVINSQFRKTPNQNPTPVENVLQEHNAIVKNNQVSNGKGVLKKKVSNCKTTKVLLKKKRSLRGAKKVPNTTLNEIKCKTDVTTKKESQDDVIKINNITNAKLSNKRNINLPLNRKVLKAGPMKIRKLINDIKEIKKHNTEENDTINLKMHTDNCLVNRRASPTSSDKSWTKDLSSSSNSSLVTVLSKDFYLIDNKIPILQLNNIDIELLRYNKKCIGDRTEGSKIVDNYSGNETDKQNNYLNVKCSLSNTSSSDSCTTKFSDSKYNTTENNGTASKENVENETYSLNLSISSTSSSRSSPSSLTSSNTSYVGNSNKNSGSEKGSGSTKTQNKETILQKLNFSLNKFDINKIKFSKNKNELTNNNPNVADYVKTIQDKIFSDDVSKDENDLCSLCQAIMQLNIDDVDEYFNLKEFQESSRLSSPISPETINSLHEINYENKNVEDSEQTDDNIQSYYYPPEEVNTEKKYENSLANNTSVDNDDDDALSLFAESFTELESCRRNSTIASEEYIPQPMVAHIPQQRAQITYKPTKIINNNIEDGIAKFTNICEKNKADSTSLSDNNLNLREDTFIYEDRMGELSKNSSKPLNIVSKNAVWPNKPRLMALIHKTAKQSRKSIVFTGCCYFNLKAVCQKRQCFYPHVYLDVNDVKKKLKTLSEESFIQEYMHMRCYVKLRRRYILCFLEECVRRELTRISVEMAIDTIQGTDKHSPEDNAIKSEVVDTVLMYLNHVDLSACSDLLGYKLCLDRMLLCDFFMSVIATSQNFSRFKPVFVNLTAFMYQHGRTFSETVAESILERLCILPYDEALARALLLILKRTDVTVFSNKRICDLERQLFALNSKLYHEFKLLKHQALVNPPVLENQYEHTYESLPNTDVLYANRGHAPKTVITQGTLNLGIPSDPIDTKFTRTVNLKRLEQTGFRVNEKKIIMEHNGKSPLTNREKPRVTAIAEDSNSKSMEYGATNTLIKWTRPEVPNNATSVNSNSRTMVHSPTINWTRPSVNGVCGNADQNFNNWRNRNFGNTTKRIPTSFPPRPPRPPKRHSDWSFEGTTAKFKRNKGPNSYHRDSL